MGFKAQALLSCGRLVPRLEGGRPASSGPLALLGPQSSRASLCLSFQAVGYLRAAQGTFNSPYYQATTRPMSTVPGTLRWGLCAVGG